MQMDTQSLTVLNHLETYKQDPVKQKFQAAGGSIIGAQSGGRRVVSLSKFKSTEFSWARVQGAMDKGSSERIAC